MLGFINKFVEKTIEAINKAREFLGLTSKASVNVVASGSGATGSFKASTKKATGGYLMAGQTSIVNERGVEYFTPTKSGYVIPNNKLGANQYVVNVTGTFLSEDAGLKVADLVLQTMKLHGAIV